MIRKKNEGTADKRVLGGTGIGEAALLHKFTQEEMFGKARLCAEIVLAPGQTAGEHEHTGEFEIFYVLEGELVSCGEGKADEPFRAGDMMLTGGGEKHALRNDSDAPATMLAIIVL